MRSHPPPNAHPTRRLAARLAFTLALGLSYVGGCKGAPPQFFPLPDTTAVTTGEVQGKEVEILLEHVLISDPPREPEALKALMEHYNEQTLTPEMKGRYGSIVRYFYAESADLPRDDQEANRGYFNHDRIEFHGEEHLGGVSWEQGKPGVSTWLAERPEGHGCGG